MKQRAKHQVPPRPGTADDDALLTFYAGVGPDTEGRMLEEILAWDDVRLELCHDYIQWLFPNAAPSAVNPDAPLVTPVHVAAFATRPALRENLLRALRRMLAFYGLKLTTRRGGEPRVIPAENWAARCAVWLTAHNHNHLRLTRILISLRLLGLPGYAIALFTFLNELSRADGGAALAETTLDYWRSAAEARAD